MKTKVLLAAVVLLASLIGPAKAQQVSTEQAEATQVYDAVIVPGFPFDDEEGRMNMFQRMRLFWAYHLYATGKTKNIIVSGGAVHSPYVEAEIFAIFLQKLGVDPRHIIIENRAEHSTENVFYSLELAHNHGFSKVAVATDPFQSGMIAFLTNRDKLPVDFIPAMVETVAVKYWKTFQFNINDKAAFREDFVPLVERKDKAERKKGTQGDAYRERKQGP